jgi:hypothetical protein
MERSNEVGKRGRQTGAGLAGLHVVERPDADGHVDAASVAGGNGGGRGGGEWWRGRTEARRSGTEGVEKEGMRGQGGGQGGGAVKDRRGGGWRVEEEGRARGSRSGAVWEGFAGWMGGWV